MSVYDETLEILHKYKIQANKSLGQNFLVADDVIENIIESANIDKEDLVIEIGPGLGVLTNRLLQKAGQVVAVELDEKMVRILQDRFKSSENLEIINEDILKIDLQEIIKRKSKKNVKVVANLPYYISTPIIMKLLENNLAINEIIVMVQKEVAQRLTARTGTRIAGAITYAVEYYSEAEEIISVPPESFIPSPKVDSEVIRLKIRKEPKVQVNSEKILFEVIQKSFMQRRKTLANSLVNSGIIESKEKMQEMLESLGLDENIRGESLSLEQFAQIANYIK